MSLQTSAIDFVAYDKRGDVVLLAEARGRTGTSGEWAALFRRNLLSHGVLPQSRFFLIAAKDSIYVWKGLGSEALEVPPDFSVSSRVALGPSLEELGGGADLGSGEAFELLVYYWLTRLADAPAAPVSSDPSLCWLSQSGFLQSIRNARIEYLPQ